MKKNKNLAFTLAEVLIVIGIIGVVAALTLPNLNHATGDKERVTKVKKIYSTLTEAVDRAQAIYGDAETWDNDLNDDTAAVSERFAKRITEFMKISKDCGFNPGCFSTANFKWFAEYPEGESHLNFLQEHNSYMVMLSDGVALGFRVNGDKIDISVDIDGPNKGNNLFGSDIFDFTIGFHDDTCGYWCKANQLSYAKPQDEGYIFSYPTAWVIENGNLDYLKCYDELNWETKTSCE